LVPLNNRKKNILDHKSVTLTALWNLWLLWESGSLGSRRLAERKQARSSLQPLYPFPLVEEEEGVGGRRSATWAVTRWLRSLTGSAQ
jgi:hypothetical protein